MCDKPNEFFDFSQLELKETCENEFFNLPLILDDDYDHGHEPEDLQGAREYSEGKASWFANTEIFPRFRLDEVPHPKRD